MYHGAVDHAMSTRRRAERGRARLRRRPLAVAAALALGVLGIVGCAPQAQAPSASAPLASETERVARVIYHRMAIGYLETGSYTTNVLVDVTLPEGTRWTLADYPQDGSSYVLLVTSDADPGVAWRVTPAGVERVAGG